MARTSKQTRLAIQYARRLARQQAKGRQERPKPAKPPEIVIETWSPLSNNSTTIDELWWMRPRRPG
jgi:hypothetical protein